ncbi:hypothetical protein EVAR_36720_1 [Eumeta japonica]|uniref:Uncharacterized protein n=1 Tax=Eumeta variegata TaxID=151549 RepID=A0A4C1XPP9_EUMVA|nr:hypothetical protein EVAR_36720_1 [Eumeta japonica]
MMRCRLRQVANGYQSPGALPCKTDYLIKYNFNSVRPGGSCHSRIKTENGTGVETEWGAGIRVKIVIGTEIREQYPDHILKEKRNWD